MSEQKKPSFVQKWKDGKINRAAVVTTVILIVAVAAMAFLMIYYLSGFWFGFVKNPYRLTLPNFFKFFLPIAVIVLCTEVIRFIMMAQKSRAAHVMCYLSSVLADLLICSNLSYVTAFNRFMDLVAGALFPALVANLFYNYLSRRYGMYPPLAMHAMLALHSYFFSITSGVAESLVNLFLLFLPIVLYLFIDSAYEHKRRYALKNTPRIVRYLSHLLTAAAVIIIIGTVMLISNHFRYGALVIATESMTGALNKGDVVIFESYTDQHIEEGQVIVFEKSDTMIVHRVIDIKVINGSARYYTKGDANDDPDADYITDASIVGLANHRIPVLGYPTLWMRSLFKR